MTGTDPSNRPAVFIATRFGYTNFCPFDPRPPPGWNVQAWIPINANTTFDPKIAPSAQSASPSGEISTDHAEGWVAGADFGVPLRLVVRYPGTVSTCQDLPLTNRCVCKVWTCTK